MIMVIVMKEEIKPALVCIEQKAMYLSFFYFDEQTLPYTHKNYYYLVWFGSVWFS